MDRRPHRSGGAAKQAAVAACRNVAVLICTAAAVLVAGGAAPGAVALAGQRTPAAPGATVRPAVTTPHGQPAGTAGPSVGTGVTDESPTYLHDAARSGASADTTISVATAPTLTQLYAAATGGPIVAAPAVSGGVAYVGSWDGFMYAFTASNGKLRWKTSLGTSSDPPCHPPTLGITSSATVVGTTVYVGGGDAYWYALDTATGAVLWRVFTGDNTPQSAHYNWSSPLIVGNLAYIGIASNCDAPLVQGQVLKVDLTTHQLVGTFNVVPNGQFGGGVWTTPAYDGATNTVFVSTGTLNLYTQTLSQAVVAIDAGTMTLRSHWQLPFEAAVSDSDWGTTPTLTADSRGRQLLTLANKNGTLFTFLRNNLDAGPIWTRHIAVGGDCPTCGDGTISSGAFANGVVYYGSGSNIDSAGRGHGGSVSALDPGTGNLLWYHPTLSPVIPALAFDNGMVLDAQGSILEVLDAATGHAVWTDELPAGIYGAPVVAEGRIYVGDLDSALHAFGLPGTPPPPPPPDPSCPAGFTCQDVNSPTIAGSETVNPDGSWAVTAAGSGIQGTVDQFRFISQPVGGDAQAVVQVVSQQIIANQRSQAGIAMRQSADPRSPLYGAWMIPQDLAENEPQPKIVVWWRESWGGVVRELTKLYPVPQPAYIMTQRHGDVFATSWSKDGVHYTLIPGTEHTVVMPWALQTGVIVDSRKPANTDRAVVSHVATGPITVTPVEPPSPDKCPSGWSCASIGNPAPVGDATLTGGTWALLGTGQGIGAASDQFDLVYQSVPGDATLTADVTAVGSSSPGAKAGLMFRQNLTETSPFYGIFLTSATGALVQWRSYDGLVNRLSVPLPSLNAPAWLRLTRFTDTGVSPAATYYAASTSSDGQSWAEVPGSTQTVNLGPGPTLAGIAATSNVGGASDTNTLSSVSIASGATRPAGACAAEWTCGDVGTGFVAGTQSFLNNAWTFQAGGADIWDVYDQFHFAWQPLTTDATVSARVTSVAAGADPWEKAGVLIRAGTDPQAPYYGVFVTPQNGIAVQWRTAQAAPTSQVVTPGGPAPAWVMAARWTDTAHGGTVYYTAYTSTDGRSFTAVPGSTTALSLPGPLVAGVGADSHNQATSVQVGFDNVAIIPSAPPPPGACPNVYQCADIGGATPSGDQTLDQQTGTLTIHGGGGDIWDGADQFHFVSQSLNSDGAVSAHFDSQSPTDAWAKAGVMLRGGSTAGSPYYALLATPQNGLAVQWRTTQGAATSQVNYPGTLPLWLKVARWTDAGGPTQQTYETAYTSPDGTTWTALAGSTQPVSLAAPLLAGVAVSSHNQAVLGTVVVDTVAIGGTAQAPPGFCPGPWSCADVGGATPAGTQSVNGTTWSVSGGGGDIWGTSDAFHLASRPLASDGTVSGRIVSQGNTNAWAKGGLMLRATTDPASPYYALLVTPQNGMVLQWRPTAGADTSQRLLAGTAPIWLQIARWTDTSGSSPTTYYTAYRSNDGTTWTAIPSTTTILSLPPTVLAGIAVTSHDISLLSTVVVASPALGTAAPRPAGICPGAWTCTDVGSPTPAGGQDLQGSTWTVTAGGGDIWGTSDQFRLIARSLPGDGATTAHVVSLNDPTSAWGKAGVMVRGSTDPAAAFYDVVVTPQNGVVVQARTAAGAGAVTLVAFAGHAPQWMRIVRSGTTYTAQTSADGTTWTTVAGSQLSIPALSGALSAGLALTSHDTVNTATATFDNVAAGS